VSSAYKIVFKLVICGKTLMKVKYKIGPKTLPCGTPLIIGLFLELTEFERVY